MVHIYGMSARRRKLVLGRFHVRNPRGKAAAPASQEFRALVDRWRACSTVRLVREPRSLSRGCDERAEGRSQMTTFLLRVALLVLWVFLAACAAWYMAGRSVE